MIAVICWGVLGLIHLLPAVALFRPSMISALYGVPSGSAAFLLLHHRAALFLCVLLICIWAALRSDVRPLASVVVAISMISFLWLYAAAGQPMALRQIAIADLAGLPFLAITAWLAFVPGRLV
ncbi:MAG: hypothetical protein H7251_12430 [Acetobacteraceae bacterium]|nr:hypothetical protein [Acetobacteraceae bacterium]